VWLHRGRTAAVVLAIVVGLAGAGAVLDAWALLRKVTHDEYLATNPASATVHSSPPCARFPRCARRRRAAR